MPAFTLYELILSIIILAIVSLYLPTSQTPLNQEDINLNSSFNTLLQESQKSFINCTSNTYLQATTNLNNSLLKTNLEITASSDIKQLTMTPFNSFCVNSSESAYVEKKF